MSNTIFSENRIMILDGAMGTMLQKYGAGAGESDNITHPDIVERIHREYIAAGANIIETNTFGADYACSLEGARIARRAADSAGRKILVAGSAGPMSKSLSMGIDADRPDYRPVGFIEMEGLYREQIRGLQDGGADFLLIETCFDPLNVKAAIKAWDSLGRKIPVAISASCSDASGRVLTGQTLKAFYTAVKHCDPVAFGLNCSLGADRMLPLIREISSFASCPVICYPNAGLPNEMGQYDQTPAEMAEGIRRMAEKGLVNIVGGCCGSTPEHIRAIAGAVRDLPPRIIPDSDRRLHVSGLEDVTIDLATSNFTNIGERTNVAGSRKFARLVASGDYDGAMAVASQQIENGARIIDINLDDPMLDSRAEMERFVRIAMTEPDVAKAALMIDSSDFETILAGLRNAQGRCIVNSISLKEGPESFVAKARRIDSMGAAMVVMAFDEEGQATSFERKTEICGRAYRLLTEAGIRPENIIFDVNVLTVGTGMESDRRYARDFIEAVRWIKANLPGALTSGGVSNLSFAFRGNNPVREAMHSVFLYHAIEAGLDMAIVNPGMLQPYDSIPGDLRKAVEDVILDSDPGATERLIAAASHTGTGESTRVAERGPMSLEELLIKGATEGLQERVEEQLDKLGDAAAVIGGPLMQAMEKIGEMFAEGKMFLPQVVKSAKVMKMAVALLEPHISADTPKEKIRPRFLIATVQGDVHDIGKNITASVLSCNGFEVTDLGVMVDCERIVSEAERIGADIIGVSGLITPSLAQMENLCALMRERGLTTPLFVGGATTSDAHTALKLAPLYSHVFHCQDASATAVMAKRYMHDPVSFEHGEHARQEALAELWQKGRRTPEPVSEAFGECLTSTQLQDCDIPVREVPAAEIAPFVEWKTYLSIMGIKAPDYGRPEVRAMLSEAREALACLRCSIKVGVKFVPAGEFPGEMPLRRFVADDSPLGLFAAAVHAPDGESCTCPDCSDLRSKVLRLCLADAVSRWIESRLQVPKGFRCILPAIGYPSCPDHTMKAEVLKRIPGSDAIGITLTSSTVMSPDASVCGFIVMHPDAHYL